MNRTILFLSIFAFCENVFYKIHSPVKSVTAIKNNSIINNNDSLIVSIMNNKQSLNLSFKNKSGDTLYILSSYFYDGLYSSKYLRRYNRFDNEVKLSFRPLLPYLSPRISDRIVENKILNKNQLNYRFLVVCPDSTIAVTFEKDVLFNLENGKMKVVADFDDAKYYTYSSKVKFKQRLVKLSCLKKLSLEIAYYRDTTSLNDEKVYYLNENHYNEIAKKFNVIKTDVLPLGAGGN